MSEVDHKVPEELVKKLEEAASAAGYAFNFNSDNAKSLVFATAIANAITALVVHHIRRHSCNWWPVISGYRLSLQEHPVRKGYYSISMADTDDKDISDFAHCILEVSAVSALSSMQLCIADVGILSIIIACMCTYVKDNGRVVVDNLSGDPDDEPYRLEFATVYGNSVIRSNFINVQPIIDELPNEIW